MEIRELIEQLEGKPCDLPAVDLVELKAPTESHRRGADRVLPTGRVAGLVADPVHQIQYEPLLHAYPGHDDLLCPRQLRHPLVDHRRRQDDVCSILPEPQLGGPLRRGHGPKLGDQAMEV